MTVSAAVVLIRIRVVVVVIDRAPPIALPRIAHTRASHRPPIDVIFFPPPRRLTLASAPVEHLAPW